MKTAEFKSLGLVLRLQVPESTAEFDTNAKRAGACLDEAIANIIYRGSLAQFRDEFIHGRDADAEKGITAFKGLEDTYKLPRKTVETGKKDDKGNPILRFDESEGEYRERLVATLVKGGKSEEAAVAELQKLADVLAPTILFDASQRERKPAQPKKLANKYKETATAIMKGAHLSRFVKDVKAALGKDWTKSTPADKTPEAVAAAADKDAEALGWLVKEFAEYKEKQTLASMVG